MGLFEHFPYTNFHDLNLDKILERTKEAEVAAAASATAAQASADAATTASTTAINTANSAVNTANTASNTATTAANSASAAAADALAAKNAAQALAAASMVVYDFKITSDIDPNKRIALLTTPTEALIREIMTNVKSGNALFRIADGFFNSSGDIMFIPCDRASYQDSDIMDTYSPAFFQNANHTKMYPMYIGIFFNAPAETVTGVYYAGAAIDLTMNS